MRHKAATVFNPLGYIQKSHGLLSMGVWGVCNLDLLLFCRHTVSLDKIGPGLDEVF